VKPFVFRIAFKIGPTRMTRDVRIIHRRLIAEGRAVWLGETFPDGLAPPPLEDVSRAVARVKALFDESDVPQAGTSLQPLPTAAADRQLERAAAS
jgi:hypothetical protein